MSINTKIKAFLCHRQSGLFSCILFAPFSLQVIFVAKRNISAGEEVTDCYGIHHLSIDRAGRQEALARGYAFDCLCQGCQKDLPLLQKLPVAIPANVAVKLGTTLSK